MGTLRRTCVTVPQLSELRFGVMFAVGRGTVVLDEGQRSPTGRGRFAGFVLHFHNGKCHCHSQIQIRTTDSYRQLQVDIVSCPVQICRWLPTKTERMINATHSCARVDNALELRTGNGEAIELLY